MRAAWVGACLAAAMAAAQPLVVVHSEGGTVPASRHVDGRVRGLEAAARSAAARARVPNGGAPERREFYPVPAGPLRAGDGPDVVERPAGTAAVFVVGPGDEEWLRRMAPRLRSSGAAGVAVGLRDRGAFEALRVAAAAEGLAIAPVDGAAVAAALGVSRRPVLVEPAR